MPSKRVRVFFLLMIFVVPYAVIYLSGLPHWVGRLIGMFIFVSLMTFAIFAFGISSKVKMILAGGKLSRPEFARVRPKVELGIRTFVVAFGLFFAIYVSIPFAMDLGDVLASRAPIKVVAQVRASSGLLVFFRQSIYLQNPDVRGGLSYRLLYSLNPVRSGSRYELSVLPRSRMVVDCVQIKN